MALIKSIDTAAARAMPGVLAVYTGADLAKAGYGGITSRVPLKSRDGSAFKAPERPALQRRQGALRRRSRRLRDRREPPRRPRKQPKPSPSTSTRCPRCIDPRTAMQARLAVWDAAPDNLVLDYLYGEPDKVAAAFAGRASRHAHAAGEQAPRRRRDGAARLRRRLRQGERPLHALRADPRRARLQGQRRGPDEGRRRTRCGSSPSTSAARSA